MEPSAKKFLEISWTVVPWETTPKEFQRSSTCALLKKCGYTLFRLKESASRYLVADFDPDVARLLAHKNFDLIQAAKWALHNLNDDLSQAEVDLEQLTATGAEATVF